MARVVRIAEKNLTGFAREILAGAGLRAADAEIVAEVLVWANLRGVDSHGIIRLPRYLNFLSEGAMNPRPEFRILRESGAIAVLDADRGPGPTAMIFAAERAAALARKNGIGLCLVKATTHTGPIGYYARAAARQGCIGIVLAASTPIMAYHGARTAVFSTSPIAIAVPTRDAEPYMLDMASSVAALGRIRQAIDSNQRIPDGWALDSTGEPTTDPNTADILLPLGGPKGAALAFMIECLTGLLADNPLTEPTLAGRRRGHGQNGLVIAIDVAAFLGRDAFETHIAALAAIVKDQPPAAGVDEILAPGERGDHVLIERRRDGIPIPQATWARLGEIAAKLGVVPPAEA